jgi:nickel/cobalt transporter (NicO) family protein
MTSGAVAALTATAAVIGSLHTLAPDHWVPFAALARARGWSTARTARTTFICGFGHVTVSAALGILALVVGLNAVHAMGSHLESYATVLLIGFGLAYMLWGFWRSRVHAHGRPGSNMTEWTLFLVFSADPCVAIIPMIMAASAGGWTAVALVTIAYEIATIATMIILATGMLAGVKRMTLHWADHYGDAVAGGVIVMVGVAMMILGW